MVWAVVPANAPLGWMNVTLTVNTSSVTGKVYVGRSSFGLFSAISDGSGPAIAQNVTDGAPPVLNRLTAPAVPGQYVTLWGTGLGDFTTSDVSLEIYGSAVQPSFAGHAPGQPGMDQINFRLPADVPFGCYVPVVVTVGGTDVSNQVTVATTPSPGTPCIHPRGLSVDQLKTLDQGGSIMFGSLNTDISTYPSVEAIKTFERHERVGLSFPVANAQSAFSGPLEHRSPTCTLMALPSFSGPRLSPISGPSYGDAGPSINLSGPGQKTWTIPATISRTYSKDFDTSTAPSLAAMPELYTAGGTWTLDVPGGVDVAAFQRTFTLPAPLHLTNRDAVTTIDRARDFVIAWDMPADSSGGLVTIQLSTYPPDGTSVPTGLSYGISCKIAAQAGSLGITRDWLQNIAATLPGYSSALSISSDAVSPSPITFPIRAGGAAPLSVYRYTYEWMPVVVR